MTDASVAKSALKTLDGSEKGWSGGGFARWFHRPRRALRTAVAARVSKVHIPYPWVQNSGRGCDPTAGASHRPVPPSSPGEKGVRVLRTQ